MHFLPSGSQNVTILKHVEFSFFTTDVGVNIWLSYYNIQIPSLIINVDSGHLL